MTITEAFEQVRLAQEKFDLMLYVFSQIARNEELEDTTADRFSDTAVREADNALSEAKMRLAKTPGANAEDILRKVTVLTDPDNHDLFVPIKAEIEALLGDDDSTPEPNEPQPNPVYGNSSERVPLNVPKAALEKLSSHDLFALYAAADKQCSDLTTSEHAYELIYDLYSAFRKELVSREPESFDELVLILMAMFDKDDFSSWAGGERVYARCQAFIEKAFNPEQQQEAA